MGTWGMRAFDNDEAMDWTGELEEHGVKAITTALRAISLDEGEYVEAPECSAAIAAAEVVAALTQNPSDDLPDEIADWVETKPAFKPDLVKAAIAAVDRIRRSSELLELWQDAEPQDFKDWTAATDDLLKRLAKAQPR